MRHLRFVVVCAALAAAVACGSSTSPSPVNIAGTWKGTVTDSQLGSGNVTAIINQSNAAVTGTWSATYTNTANKNAGSLSGTIDGSNVTILLKPSAVNSCGIQLTATSDGSTMNGTYSTVQC